MILLLGSVAEMMGKGREGSSAAASEAVAGEEATKCLHARRRIRARTRGTKRGSGEDGMVCFPCACPCLFVWGDHDFSKPIMVIRATHVEQLYFHGACAFPWRATGRKARPCGTRAISPRPLKVSLNSWTSSSTTRPSNASGRLLRSALGSRTRQGASARGTPARRDRCTSCNSGPPVSRRTAAAAAAAAATAAAAAAAEAACGVARGRHSDHDDGGMAPALDRALRRRHSRRRCIKREGP